MKAKTHAKKGITKSKQQSVRTTQQYREQKRVRMAVSHNLKIPCNGD
jgi:hypothetical protein